MKKDTTAILALTIWMILVPLFMLGAASLNLEILFVLWLIGLLIITELIRPSFVQSRSHIRLSALIAAGILLFGIIIIRKVQVILSG